MISTRRRIRRTVLAVTSAALVLAFAFAPVVPASAIAVRWWCVGTSGGDYEGEKTLHGGYSLVMQSPCGNVSVRIHYYPYVGAPSAIWSAWVTSTPPTNSASINWATGAVIGTQHKSSLSSTIHSFGS